MLAFRTLIRKPTLIHQHTSKSFAILTFKMSTSAALYTSESLKAANATSFGTLKAKLDPALLQALQEIGFEFMTPVQEKVMNELPRVNSDWYGPSLETNITHMSC